MFNSDSSTKTMTTHPGKQVLLYHVQHKTEVIFNLYHPAGNTSPPCGILVLHDLPRQVSSQSTSTTCFHKLVLKNYLRYRLQACASRFLHDHSFRDSVQLLYRHRSAYTRLLSVNKCATSCSDILTQEACVFHSS